MNKFMENLKEKMKQYNVSEEFKEIIKKLSDVFMIKEKLLRGKKITKDEMKVLDEYYSFGNLLNQKIQNNEMSNFDFFRIYFECKMGKKINEDEKAYIKEVFVENLSKKLNLI